MAKEGRYPKTAMATLTPDEVLLVEDYVSTLRPIRPASTVMRSILEDIVSGKLEVSMQPRDSIRVSIAITDETVKKLKEIKDKTGLSPSDLVVRGVEALNARARALQPANGTAVGTGVSGRVGTTFNPPEN